MACGSAPSQKEINHIRHSTGDLMLLFGATILKVFQGRLDELHTFLPERHLYENLINLPRATCCRTRTRGFKMKNWLRCVVGRIMVPRPTVFCGLLDLDSDILATCPWSRCNLNPLISTPTGSGHPYRRGERSIPAF